MNRELVSEDTIPLGNSVDNTIPRTLSIEEVSRRFSGKDLITNIKILYGFICQFTEYKPRHISTISDDI